MTSSLLFFPFLAPLLVAKAGRMSHGQLLDPCYARYLQSSDLFLSIRRAVTLAEYAGSLLAKERKNSVGGDLSCSYSLISTFNTTLVLITPTITSSTILFVVDLF